MKADHLIDMANRIGEFFAAYPDRAEALEGIAQHIARFWEPRMRRAILEALDTPAADSLQPLVAQALRDHRGTLLPAA